jgi:hypothetical protein
VLPPSPARLRERLDGTAAGAIRASIILREKGKHPVKRRTVWAVPLAALALLPLLWIVGIVALPYLPWKLVYACEIRQGNEIVSKIEDFRQRYRRLPDPDDTEAMSALGFELIIGYRPAYRSVGQEAYELEYYVGFDGPRIIYSSTTRQWSCEMCD